MPRLRSLVRDLLATNDLSPAPWGQGTRPAGHTTVAKLGVPVAPILREYARAAESRPFRASVASLLSAGGGFYWAVWPVLVPSALATKQGRSTLVTLLAGCVPLAIDPDSGAFLIADWRTSMVASFLFDDVVESDPEPGDFVVESATLERCLRNLGDPARRPRENAASRELERLYRRGIWLCHLLCKADIDPGLGRIAHTARDASPLAIYRRERNHFAARPHYAMYWLLAFAVLGAADHLTEALAHAKAVRHPAVVTLRTHLAAGRALVDRKRWRARELDRVLQSIHGSL